MTRSRLTRKSQTTIPKPVCDALDLEPGDEVLYEIEGDRAILRKVRSGPPEADPFATFGEWAGEADRRAYGDL